MGILNKTDFKEIDLAKQIINYKKMEKLTLEMCFKYPNAKFRELYEGKWDIHNSVIDYAAYLSNHEPEDLAERFKLILRPIESLTDEEKKIYDKLDKKIYKKDIIDYCRSINIDIDDLQEKGVAVYE